MGVKTFNFANKEIKITIIFMDDSNIWKTQ